MAEYKNICKVCGKEIITYMSNKKVCSWECRKIANREHAREFMRKKRAGYKVICIRCNGEFITENRKQNVCMACQMKY